MNDIKRNLRVIFFFFFIMFAFLTGFIVHFEIVRSSSIVNSTLNPRINRNRENVIRGNIYDINGNLLVSQSEYERTYIYGESFAHTLGFTNRGRSGIEERYNFRLLNLSLELLQRINYISFGTLMEGDSLKTTLDRGLQNFAHSQLGNNRGSIVVLDVNTGAIRAMVSNPAFNPNTINENWDSLIAAPHSPFLNRASQGLYPPGSTFKVITSILGLRLAPYFTHYCDGYIIIDGHRINNFNNVAHGNIDMTRAFALSCNTFFVALANYIGITEFSYYASEFFPEIDFSLAHSPSVFNLTYEDSIAMLMQTSIGQGQTLVNPLYLALLAASVANGGEMPHPFIVNNSISYNGNYTRFTRIRTTRIFESYYANILKEMMGLVVTEGTGIAASLQNYSLAGKTGTAEVFGADSHGLFMGFAPIENPRYAIAVVLENSGGTGPVQPIVRNVLNFAFNN